MNPAKAAPSVPVKQADDQQDTGHADEHHGQGGHPGRKMKHTIIQKISPRYNNRESETSEPKDSGAFLCLEVSILLFRTITIIITIVF